MRAFVVAGPDTGEVREVPDPEPESGHVVVDVEYVGLCGTDLELFTGDMAYLRTGRSTYPLRPGHEWCGIVTAVGADVAASWLGRRVTADTMIGCGTCARCADGRHHVCAQVCEIGIQGRYNGALAEQIVVPERSLHAMPPQVDATAGALVEPGGNAWRTVDALAVRPGERVLVLGTGSIGLLAAMFARAAGVEVHLVGEPARWGLARAEGFPVWTSETLPDLAWHGIIDASTAAGFPSWCVELVEPGRRVSWIGLSGRPSLVDTRDLVLRDITAVGILGASAGLGPAIEAYGSGLVEPHLLVAATVGLDEVARVLSGWRPASASEGPKVLVDPRR